MQSAVWPVRGSLAHCNDFHFNKYTFGELANGDSRTGRIGLGEDFAVNLVHGSEVTHVGKEHGCLYNVVDR